VAACIAKLAARWICFATLRADEFQFATALVTEFGIFGVIKLAFWAFHFLYLSMHLKVYLTGQKTKKAHTIWHEL
jgi:hypothetical protein